MVQMFVTTLLLWIATTTTTLVHALNGDSSKLSLDTYLGWKAFEIITQGDTDGSNGYTLPGELDGIGAYMSTRWEDSDTLRVLVNHETGRACDTENPATVTQIDLDLSTLQRAIENMRINGNLGSETNFVRSFGPSWDVIIDENGYEVASLPSRFRLFCSSQAYGPDTFGPGEGFADQMYIFGEEKKSDPFGRLFAIDSSARKLYQLSGAVGDASSSQGGNPGMFFDSFENIALIRTFEQDHIAFLVSNDGGSKNLKLYVGQKRRGKDGAAGEDFLARNGLAYGSWFYLNGALPTEQGHTRAGYFGSQDDGALTSEKFEDVDTNPLIPTQVVLGDEVYGVFVLDFALTFSSSDGIFQSGFSGGSSTYTITMIVNEDDVEMKQADNVLWTAADLIYVCSDGENGAVWQLESDGSGIVRVASSKRTGPDDSPSGAFDISDFLGFEPASILLVDTMGCDSSLAVLINPDARLLSAPEPTDNMPHDPCSLCTDGWTISNPDTILGEDFAFLIDADDTCAEVEAMAQLGAYSAITCDWLTANGAARICGCEEEDAPIPAPTESTLPTIAPNKVSNDGLSGGAIFGIIAAIFVFLFAIGFAIWKIARDKSKDEEVTKVRMVAMDDTAAGESAIPDAKLDNLEDKEPSPGDGDSTPLSCTTLMLGEGEDSSTFHTNNSRESPSSL